MCALGSAQRASRAQSSGEELTVGQACQPQLFTLPAAAASVRRLSAGATLSPSRARAGVPRAPGDMSDDESDEDGPKNPTTTRKVECAYCEGARARASTLPLRSHPAACLHARAAMCTAAAGRGHPNPRLNARPHSHPHTKQCAPCPSSTASGGLSSRSARSGSKATSSASTPRSGRPTSPTRTSWRS